MFALSLETMHTYKQCGLHSMHKTKLISEAVK